MFVFLPGHAVGALLSSLVFLGEGERSLWQPCRRAGLAPALKQAQTMCLGICPFSHQRGGT